MQCVGMWNEQARDSLSWEALVLAVLNLLAVMKAYLQSFLTRENGSECSQLHPHGCSYTFHPCNSAFKGLTNSATSSVPLSSNNSWYKHITTFYKDDQTHNLRHIRSCSCNCAIFTFWISSVHGNRMTETNNGRGGVIVIAKSLTYPSPSPQTRQSQWVCIACQQKTRRKRNHVWSVQQKVWLQLARNRN